MDLFRFAAAGYVPATLQDIGGSTDDRWRELYTAASSRGCRPSSGTGFAGCRRSRSRRGASVALAYNVERIERRYGQQRRRAAELAAAYAEAGIRTVVLKGFAVSRLYPVPEHRPCGDLDCFLCGDYEQRAIGWPNRSGPR